jgi:hypothetical protein
MQTNRIRHNLQIYLLDFLLKTQFKRNEKSMCSPLKTLAVRAKKGGAENFSSPFLM